METRPAAPLPPALIDTLTEPLHAGEGERSAGRAGLTRRLRVRYLTRTLRVSGDAGEELRGSDQVLRGVAGQNRGLG